MINTNFNDFQWVSQAISIILRNCQNTKNRIYTWIRTSNMLKWHSFRQKIMLQPPDIKCKLTFGVFCKSWFTLRFGRLNLEKHEIFANFPISRKFVIFLENLNWLTDLCLVNFTYFVINNASQQCIFKLRVFQKTAFTSDFCSFGDPIWCMKWGPISATEWTDVDPPPPVLPYYYTKPLRPDFEEQGELTFCQFI